MRSIIGLVLIVGGLCVSLDARAWFFIIPGSLIRAVTDSVTGSKGNICVKEGTQAGQTIDSPNGNKAKVLSVSGTSSMCRNPALPIRAELEFSYNFSSNVRIDMPEDYQQSPITDLDRFNGILLRTTSKATKNQGVIISATVRKPNSDIEVMANNMEKNILANKNFKEVASRNAARINVNGMNAVRFEIDATLGGLFGQKVTYLYTVLEGDSELVVVNTYAPTDVFAAQRVSMERISESIAGLHAADSSLAAVNSSAAASAPDGHSVAEAAAALPPPAAASANGVGSVPAAAAPASAATN